MTNGIDDLQVARRRAAERRAPGVVDDFDPARLALARRLAALPRTRLAAKIGITPAAISQFEKGQTRPTVPVLEQLVTHLNVPVEFFRIGTAVRTLSSSGAHFRSLRSTTVLERDQALSFGELALAICEAVENYVDLPPVTLPELQIPQSLSSEHIATIAAQAREAMNVPTGPIPNMVRLLEAHGAVVFRLEDVSRRVDAFSHQQGSRPLVLLNPAKGDKARSRFDAAHELGHLLMHHDVEPGSRLVEQEANIFAAAFLAPADEISDVLPETLDWTVLLELKRRWGLSLKALVMRSHVLGRIDARAYERGMRQLNIWGRPERGGLGPNEVPVLIPRAIELIGDTDAVLDQLAVDIGLPETQVRRIWESGGGGDSRPSVDPNYSSNQNVAHTLRSAITVD